MRGKLAIFILVPAALGAAAMSAPDREHPHRCHVVAGEKLPDAVGGAEAICAAVERAVAAHAPHIRFSAEVKVVTRSMLATNLVVNGRTLPEQKFAIMDREFDEASIQRFANSIAAEVAKAAKP